MLSSSEINNMKLKQCWNIWFIGGPSQHWFCSRKLLQMSEVPKQSICTYSKTVRNALQHCNVSFWQTVCNIRRRKRMVLHLKIASLLLLHNIEHHMDWVNLGSLWSEPYWPNLDTAFLPTWIFALLWEFILIPLKQRDLINCASVE